MFENWVLRKVFGPKRDEVTGEWRRRHDEELYDLYSSPNFIRMVKFRRMRWVGHVASMGHEKYIQGFGGELRERDHLEDVSVDGRIILKWIFKKWDEEAWIGLVQGRERDRLY